MYSLTQIISEGLIPGDESKKKTPQEVMNKWNVGMDTLKQKLKKGIAVEKEHSNDVKVAAEIALDHLYEDIQYYEKLSQTGLEEEDIQESPDISLEEKKKMQQVIDLINKGKTQEALQLAGTLSSVAQNALPDDVLFKFSIAEQPNETLDGQIVKMIRQGLGRPQPQQPTSTIKLSELYEQCR